MKTTPVKIDFSRLPTDYAGLCGILIPRPIHDKVDFQNITEVTDAMAGHQLTPDQEDYFDLLCQLIENYEKDRLAPPQATGLEALEHLLEAHRLGPVDLSRILKVHRTLGGMILRGERKLTLKHVRTLSRHFGISAGLFV